MHILLIHQAFAALDEPGGTRHHELAQYLAGRGHRVTVIASPVSYLTGQAAPAQGGKAAAPVPGVKILRAYTYPAWHRSFAHRVVSFVSFMLSSFLLGLRVQGVDLVWGTSPPIFQGVTAWALARLKGAPFLFEVRDLWPAFAVEVGVLRQPALIRASEWLERTLYRRAQAVMVNSPGFRAHVQARGARRVAMVPNGADTRMFDPAARGESFRREHGLGEAYVILYAGAHGLSNDLQVVLEAAERLRADPRITWVILGDGKEKPALQARAKELGLDNLVFLPPVPKTSMPAALAAADACLAILKPIPLYGTVYPNKVFDYMAAGRPVLLAIDGVIREVVEAAGGGVFVPPGDPAALADAALALAGDPKGSKAMGLAGRQHVQTHFDRAALGLQLEELLIELAA
jgi:glycosyltransferase involved in cell wall biosynthesis